MRVQFSVVGARTPDWLVPRLKVDLDAVPREGETVALPGVPAECSFVRLVEWYPLGQVEVDEEDERPFVYVVVGPRRPR